MRVSLSQAEHRYGMAQRNTRVGAKSGGRDKVTLRMIQGSRTCASLMTTAASVVDEEDTASKIISASLALPTSTVHHDHHTAGASEICQRACSYCSLRGPRRSFQAARRLQAVPPLPRGEGIPEGSPSWRQGPSAPPAVVIEAISGRGRARHHP